MRLPFFLIFLFCIVSCGGSSSNDQEESTQQLRGSALDSSLRNPAAARAAFRIDEFETGERAHALPHHTVYVPLYHPDSKEEKKAVRRIPYNFVRATTKEICIDPESNAGHGAVLFNEEGQVILTLTEPGCKRVAFAPGRYVLQLEHSGNGSTTEPSHAFVHAKYRASDSDSEFIQRIGAKNRISTASNESLRNTKTCEYINTIALGSKELSSYFVTNQRLSNAAFYELYTYFGNGLIAYGGKDADTQPSANNLLDTYLCGDTLAFQVHTDKQDGKFLKADCGYLSFSADAIEDASRFPVEWKPDSKTLQILSPDTGNEIRVVNRSKGSFLHFKALSPNRILLPFTDPSRLGTCTGYPASFKTKGPPMSHTKHYSGPAYPKIGAWTPMEMEYRSFSRRIDGGRNFILLLFDEKKIEKLLDKVPTTEVFLPGEFNTFHSVGSVGSFVSQEQDAIFLSFDSCRNCDLTGIDISNTKFHTLDLTGASIENSNFSNVKVQVGNFQKARISNTSFSGAEFGASDFSETHISHPEFDNTVFLTANQDFGANFKNATISYATFSGTDLTNADFSGASLETVAFEGVPLDNADFSNCDIDGLVLTESPIPNSQFINCNIQNAVFSKAKAANADFSGATLSNSKLAAADLSGSNFFGATIDGSTTFNSSFVVGSNFAQTTFNGASFDNVSAYSIAGSATTTFEDCTITSGSFSQSQFMESSFNNCRFQGGAFTGSTFISTSFQGVTSESDSTADQVSFANSDFSGANFSGASLLGADLSSAIFSTTEGQKDIVIFTSPTEKKKRPYNFGMTIKPANTGPDTICPNGAAGPCVNTDSYTVSTVNVDKDDEDF